MATSLGRHSARDRDETGQDGAVSGEGLLQQQAETAAGEPQTDGGTAARGRGRRHQEEITQVI